MHRQVCTQDMWIYEYVLHGDGQTHQITERTTKLLYNRISSSINYNKCLPTIQKCKSNLLILITLMSDSSLKRQNDFPFIVISVQQNYLFQPFKFIFTQTIFFFENLLVQAIENFPFNETSIDESFSVFRALIIGSEAKKNTS